jgi:FO synthase subunit 1
MSAHTLTYSHGLLVPLTRSCGAHCTYCTFKVEQDPLLSFDRIDELIRTNYDSGICEVVLCAGQALDSVPSVKSQWVERGYSTFFDYVRDICQLVLENRLFPTLDAGPMSYAQLAELAPYLAALSLSLETVNPDFARTVQTNKSIDARLETLSDAGLLEVPVNTGLLIGAGETMNDRTATLDTLAELHAKHGHIQSVTFQCVFRESGESRMSAGPEDIHALLTYARKIMPEVKRTMSVTSSCRWLESLVSEVDDIGVVFEGFDGIDWSKPYPKITEIERLVGRKDAALRPRFPRTLEMFARFGVRDPLISIFEEWMKKKEFSYYQR